MSDTFSIFAQPFTASDYIDRLFRNQTEGIRLQASYTFTNTKYETITRTGSYTMDDKGRYVMKSGWDVIGYFWDEESLGDPNDIGAGYYADQVAYALTTPQLHEEHEGKELWMEVKFVPSPVKKAGAPF